jgi:hypothetical protein
VILTSQIVQTIILSASNSPHHDIEPPSLFTITKMRLLIFSASLWYSTLVQVQVQVQLPCLQNALNTNESNLENL